MALAAVGSLLEVFQRTLTTRGLVEVDVDAFQLEVGVAMVGARGVNAMLHRKTG